MTKNLLKNSNVKSLPEKTKVCHGCKDTLDIKVDHDGNLPGWNTCKFCGKIRWCLTYLM